MTDLRLDEGVCFFALIPSDDNPFLKDIKRFREEHNWFGVLHPNGYAIVPFKITYRTFHPKTEEERNTFKNVLCLKIRQLLIQSLEYILNNNPPTFFVEDWMEVVNGTLVSMADKNCFARAKVGRIVEMAVSIIISEFITYIEPWSKKYGYAIMIDRLDPPAILLGTVNDDSYAYRFKQRLFDADINMSAYKWDVGVSIKRNFVWKHSWSSFIEKFL